MVSYRYYAKAGPLPDAEQIRKRTASIPGSSEIEVYEEERLVHFKWNGSYGGIAGLETPLSSDRHEVRILSPLRLDLQVTLKGEAKELEEALRKAGCSRVVPAAEGGTWEVWTTRFTTMKFLDGLRLAASNLGSTFDLKSHEVAEYEGPIGKGAAALRAAVKGAKGALVVDAAENRLRILARKADLDLVAVEQALANAKISLNRIKG